MEGQANKIFRNYHEWRRDREARKELRLMGPPIEIDISKEMLLLSKDASQLNKYLRWKNRNISQ